MTPLRQRSSHGFLMSSRMIAAGCCVMILFAMTIDTSSSLVFLTFKKNRRSKLSLLLPVNQAKESTITTTSILIMKMSAASAAAESCSNIPIPAFLSKVGKKKQERNFVFGYGSLICDQSRLLTNPTLGSAVAGKVAGALPVMIHHVQRVWSARTKNGWTAVGVRFEQDQNCTGVLIEVTSDELADLDKREASYNRHPICLDHIEKVSFLNRQEFYSNNHPVFDAKESNNNNNINETATDDEHIKAWIYMQRNAIFADSSHPIPQSYVDIILRGCLKISTDFAKSFIETTHGWDQNDDHNVHCYYFVDDREIPIYPKADPEFSNEHENKRIIDQLLQEHIPNVMEVRVDYDPLHHLEALSCALEQDKAHPKAIKHVVTILKKACRRKTVRYEQAIRLPDNGHPLVT